MLDGEGGGRPQVKRDPPAAAGLGRYALEEADGLLYLPQREDHDLMLEDAGTAAACFANDNMALCRPTFLFPDVREDRYFWGFAVPTRTLEALGVSIAADAARGPARRPP